MKEELKVTKTDVAEEEVAVVEAAEAEEIMKIEVAIMKTEAATEVVVEAEETAEIVEIVEIAETEVAEVTVEAEEVVTEEVLTMVLDLSEKEEIKWILTLTTENFSLMILTSISK